MADGRVSGLGPIVLHGGGEFLAGDEPALEALLALATVPASDRAAACLPGSEADSSAVRIVIVPTAAARQRPGLAGEHGARAFRRAASAAGVSVRVETGLVVDSASADSGPIAGRIAGADLVYLPGGDPDLIPALLPGTLAFRAMLAARARGAAICGASAGAMAMAEWCWTSTGFVQGFGWARDLAVAPHWRPNTRGFEGHESGPSGGLDRWTPPGIGVLGLAERTAAIELRAPDGGHADARWRIVGQGEAAWYPPGSTVPTEVAATGGTLGGERTREGESLRSRPDALTRL